MTELREYLDKKLALAKIDSALLFFSSSISLAFGVGYAYLGLTWLRYYLPMVFLGWVMPIYVGYVRGSLIEDSVEERVRGWIYFIVGLSFYAISPLLSGILSYLSVEWWITVVPITVINCLLAFLVARYLPEAVTDRIFKCLEKPLKKNVKRAFGETQIAAIFLTATLGIISQESWADTLTEPDLLSIILKTVLLLSFIASVVLSERNARRLLHLQST